MYVCVCFFTFVMHFVWICVIKTDQNEIPLLFQMHRILLYNIKTSQRIIVFVNYGVTPPASQICIHSTTGSTDQTTETIFVLWLDRKMAYCSSLLANILIKTMGSIHVLPAMKYHIKMEWLDRVVQFIWMWKVINH